MKYHTKIRQTKTRSVQSPKRNVILIRQPIGWTDIYISRMFVCLFVSMSDSDSSNQDEPNALAARKEA